MASGVCVVTGASRGIGRAVAHRMAGDGYDVVATGRDKAALYDTIALADGEIRAEPLEVTDESAVEMFFSGLEVDVLINNAGVASSAPAHRTSREDWEAAIAVNATGAFLCTRAVLAGMKTRDRGRIVTVASVAAHVGAPYAAAYTASKHAALGFIRVVASEVAGSGVTANAVCPAYVDTPMTDSTVARITERTGLEEEDARRRLAEMTPLGRLLQPEEVAHAVAFLCASESGAINGQSILLDGGGTQL